MWACVNLGGIGLYVLSLIFMLLSSLQLLLGVFHSREFSIFYYILLQSKYIGYFVSSFVQLLFDLHFEQCSMHFPSFIKI